MKSTDKMYSNNISFKVSDDRDNRIARLNRVIGYVQAVGDNYIMNNDILTKVSMLEDYKGTLKIYWCESPTNAEKCFFESAWDSIIGDGDISVEHEYTYKEI